MIQWFDANPDVAAAWRKQHSDVKKHRSDASCPLDYPTFADFYNYVRTIPQRKISGR